MSAPNWAKVSTQIPLFRPGDTILIDNWQVLHGRSAIPVSCTGRRVERVYLSEVTL
ncbi:MAG: TauD/TfdA family dioxygenase [Bryobacterales bacterium]|nr:TauD/TfdA family dioxygenase [Bryobacterales bacterium]